MNYLKIVEKDIDVIRQIVEIPILEARQNARPLLVEFMTDRLGPHSKGDDTRSPQELNDIRERDWYGKMKSEWGDAFEQAEAKVRRGLGQIVDEVESASPSESKLYL